MIIRHLLAGLLCVAVSFASYGDRLPEFRDCVEVCQEENCAGVEHAATSIPIHRRLLLWTCPAECDYTCQHIITRRRTESSQPVVQFHGKWPFTRMFGVQEPASVVFSLGNLLAHQQGLAQLRLRIPASYPLRKYYVLFAYFGTASWIFSIIFHARDFNFTEQMDYFAAGASVLYGLYYTPIRLFRLDLPSSAHEKFPSKSILRLWTAFCFLLFTGHVAYLKLWRWDYTYNMAANVVVGITQNMLWSWFSWNRYRRHRKGWAMWPGVVVTWVLVAMSLELADFPPWLGIFDAHSLWHAGTIAPTWLWYRFLLKDAQDDIEGKRLKA